MAMIADGRWPNDQDILAHVTRPTRSVNRHSTDDRLDILRRHDFARSDDYPDKMERYQPEALVHRHLPAAALRGIACDSAATRRRIETMVHDSGLALKVAVRTGWYFA